MKMLWLSHLIPYPPKAGVLLRSYNLLHELSKYHEVDLLSFIQRDFMDSFFPSYSSGIEESMNVLSSFCGKVKFVPIPCDNMLQGKKILALKSLFADDPYTINWLKSAEFTDELKKYITGTNYDLVHFDTISLAPYKNLIKAIPTVLDHHNIESHMMLRRAENETNLLLKYYYKQEGKRLESYEKTYCKTFDLNITCSKLDSDRLLQIDSDVNVEEVPNGVDITYFTPQNVIEDPNSLIFVGSMNWYPNIEAIHFFYNDVWSLLKSKIPNCVLHIVGANPPESIRNYAADSPNIFVHGYVDDVRPFISKAAVYICPIRDGGGTKLKLLDAFSMGKAVVAHPVACEGINVTAGQDVMFAETPAQYVDAIIDLFDNQPLRKELGVNARRMVELNYSYISIGKAMSTLYEKLLHHSSDRG